MGSNFAVHPNNLLRWHNQDFIVPYDKTNRPVEVASEQMTSEDIDRSYGNSRISFIRLIHDWVRTNKFDQRARLVADGHYNRQKVGSPQFAPRQDRDSVCGKVRQSSPVGKLLAEVHHARLEELLELLAF